jgi:hypothetical protein
MEIDVKTIRGNELNLDPKEFANLLVLNERELIPALPMYLPRLPSNRPSAYKPRKRVGDNDGNNVFRPPTAPNRNNVVNIKRK